MKNHFLLISFLIFSMPTLAQKDEHLLNSAGNATTSIKYTLTYSFGEPMVMSGNTQNYRLSVGYISADPVESITSKKVKTTSPAKVYPNPFREVVNVELRKGANLVLNLYDLDGSLILSKNVQNKSKLIIPQEVNSGCYILEIIDKDTAEKSFSKIIKY